MLGRPARIDEQGPELAEGAPAMAVTVLEYRGQLSKGEAQFRQFENGIIPKSPLAPGLIRDASPARTLRNERLVPIWWPKNENTAELCGPL